MNKDQIFFFLKISVKAEQLDEEKEAFDDAEKGKLAPETETKTTKTPDKKPIVTESETKNPVGETGDAKDEEKKSNGAHTPV